MRRGRGAGAVEGKSTADGRRTEEGGRTGPRASGHGTVEWSVVGLATGRRPFRPGSTRPCSRRSNGHAGYVDMSHARERGGHRGGRGACGPGRAAGTARDRRQVRRAPLPSSLCSLSTSPRRPPLPAFHSSPSSLSSPPFLSSPLSLQCPLACCRAASPYAHLEMEARTAMHPTALFSPPRSAVPSVLPSVLSASVPTRIPPQTAQLGLGTGVASHLPTTHRHARRPSPRGRCV